MNGKTASVAAIVALVVLVALWSASVRPPERLQLSATATPTATEQAYPGGPVATQTPIATGVYEGESLGAIADAVADRLVDDGWAAGTPELVSGAEMTGSDGVTLPVESDFIQFQSATDVGLVFSGAFTDISIGQAAAGSGGAFATYDYVLVLVDTDSGAFRGWWFSDSATELTEKLP